jgi:predicted dithiol-disulfide oxidoreductase (DUF899 family)
LSVLAGLKHGPALKLISYVPESKTKIKTAGGTLRHFYSGHPWLGEEIKERGIDELSPIWNILDLTPQGRGDFYTSLDYGAKAKSA